MLFKTTRFQYYLNLKMNINRVEVLNHARLLIQVNTVNYIVPLKNTLMN